MRALIGGVHYGDRGAEWLAAFVLTGWATTLLLPGNSFASPTYSTFDETGLGELFWSPLVGGIGLFRLVTLFINGRSPKSALWRRVGAALGIMVWTQLIVSLAASSITVLHAASPALGVYPVLLVFDGISFWRAVRDVRYRR